MSEGEERRYDATPARKRRAAAEGNLARSGELSGVAAFGAAALTALFAVPAGAGAAAAVVRGAAAQPLASISVPALVALAGAGLAPAAAAAAAGALAGLAQGGLHPAGVRVEAKRLDPVAGLKRLAGAEALIGVTRAACAFAAALLTLAPLAAEIVGAGKFVATPAAATALGALAALRACAAAFAVGALFAGLDYVLVRRRWLRGLRMSFEELKRDAKENDGDPQLRARRKQAHRGIARGAIGRVREASFIVVNPTHVAVAIRYAPPNVAVPEILVRALDEVALRVRELGRAHGVPIVENAPLARLLYARGQNGRAIPPDAYVAVAHVVAALVRDGLLT